MKLLKKTKIPPTPQFYNLLYTYVTGQNAELNGRINAIFQRGATPDAEIAHALHDEFLAPTDADEKITDVSAEIATKLKEMNGAIGTAVSSAHSYSGVLKSASGNLATGIGQKEFSVLAKNLLSETESMQSTNSALTKNLQSAQDDIASLQRELEQVRLDAMRDPLTKINNRKSFDRTIDLAIESAEQSGDLLSLIMVDIDHFKKFNDNHGHQTGDQVLHLVAQTLETNVKDIDLAARYGGEEFAVVVADADLNAAEHMAEKLRKQIQSKVLVKRSTNENLGRVTASFGVASFHAGDTKASLIERADKCLYAAKNNGRNQVIGEESILISPEVTGEANAA